MRGGYGIFYAPEGRHDTSIRQFRQVPFDLIFSDIPGALIPGNKVSQGFKTLKDFPPIDPKNPFGNLRGITPDFRNADIQQFGSPLDLGPAVKPAVPWTGRDPGTPALQRPFPECDQHQLD
jgi:hypothetical protein